MSFDSIMQEGHGEFARSHHHTIWIFLHSSHLIFELLEGGLLDHTGICWDTENTKCVIQISNFLFQIHIYNPSSDKFPYLQIILSDGLFQTW